MGGLLKCAVNLLLCFFAAILLLTYGCHKIDCIEDQVKRKP